MIKTSMLKICLSVMGPSLFLNLGLAQQPIIGRQFFIGEVSV
jgi:hypothetical protein